MELPVAAHASVGSNLRAQVLLIKFGNRSKEEEFPAIEANYDRPTNQPSKQPTNQRTIGFIGKLHFKEQSL